MTDEREALIRAEAARLFGDLPAGAVRVRAMQLLAALDEARAENERLREEHHKLRTGIARCQDRFESEFGEGTPWPEFCERLLNETSTERPAALSGSEGKP